MEQYEKAEEVLRRSLQISEETRHMLGVGRAYWGLGNLRAFEEDWDDVVELCVKSAHIFSDIDAPFDLGWARFVACIGWLRQGEYEEGRLALRLASDLFSGVGDLSAMTLILDIASVLALGVGDRRAAAFTAGAAHRLKEDTGVKIEEVDINQWPESVEFLADLSVDEQAAYDEGFVADLPDVIAELRALLD
jgi:hypothetical protein